MKRIVSLALAALLLLAAVACAESTASVMRLDDLSINILRDGKAKTVRLAGMSISVALGSPDGIPTVQGTFDNGEGQMVDGVLQIVDSELLLSVGGVSGAYYIDLESVAPEAGDGASLARALSSALKLAGPHLDLVLYAMTTEGADGARTMEVSLPAELFAALSEALLDIAEGLDSAEDVDADALRERIAGLDESPVLRLTYRPETGEIALAATEGGKGLELAASMTMDVQQMIFVGIGPEEEKHDLLNLDAATLDQLRGELNLILMKVGHFAEGTGISKLLGL